MDLIEYSKQYKNICYYCNNTNNNFDILIPCPINIKPNKICKSIITKDNTIQRFTYNICDPKKSRIYSCEKLYHIDCCLPFIKSNNNNLKYINSICLYYSLVDDLTNLNDIKIVNYS